MKNTFVKVLSLLMALMMAVGVFSTVSFAAECTHEGTTEATPVPPTCKTNGYTRYECTKCEENWVGNIIPASPDYHDWKDVGAESATCLVGSHPAGKVCQTCGEKTFKYNDDKLDHAFVRTKTELTCTQDEAYVYVCGLCGNSAEKLYGNDYNGEYKKVVITPAEGCKPENYKWEVVSMPKNGTVCEDGLAVGTCSFCGKTAQKVLKVEHVYVAVADNLGHACALYKSGEVCKFCGQANPENPPVLNADPAHSFDYANKIGMGATLEEDTNIAGWNFAKFAEIGIFVGDKISYAATCTTPGQYVGLCACGAPVKVTIRATEHTYGNFGAEVKFGVPGADGQYPAWDALSATQTLCVQDGVQARQCSGCPAVDYRVVIEGAADHNWKDVEIAPTCTANGYTLTDCQTVGCQYVAEKHTYTDKLNHKTMSKPFVQADDPANENFVAYCGGLINWVKGCELCKNQDGSYAYKVDATADLTDAQKDHKYTKQNFAATCTAPAYTEEICDWCGSAKAGTKVNVAGSTPNTSAHNYTEYKKNGDVFYTSGFENINWADDSTKSTCYSYGTSVWTCTLCGDLKVDTSATYAAHTPASNWKDKAANGQSVDVKAVAPTCMANGWTAGTACTGCGLITVEREVVENNPNDITQHSNYKQVASGVATCTTRAYVKYTTTCHGVITIYSGELAPHTFYTTPDDPDTIDVDETVWNYVDFNAPSCETTGNHRYIKCVNCTAVLPGSVDGEGCTLVNGSCPYGYDHAILGLYGNTNANIPAIGTHNYFTEDEAGFIAKVEETCDNPGTAAMTTCKRCGKVKVFTVNDGEKEFNPDETEKITKAATIDAHGKFYTRYIAPVTPTCTREGVRANDATGNMWCTKCMNKYDNPETPAVEGYKLAKVAHVYNAEENVIINWNGTEPENCMKPYGYVETCVNCGHVEATIYNAINDKADHVWEDKAATTVVGANCFEGGYRLYECTKCPAEKKEEQTNPTKHYEEKNGQKTEFDLSCTEIAKYDGKYCAACGYIVDASGKKTNNADKDLYYLHADHNEVTKTQTATCSQDGFNIVYCADCGVTLVNGNYTPAYGHTYAALSAINKAEHVVIKDSYIDFVCGFCGESIRENKAPQLTVTVNASADKVAAGETFTVTYALSGVAHTISTLNLQATITGAATIVGIESNIDGMYAVLAPNGGISIIVANNAESEAQTKTTDAAGEVLFTLTLKANETAATGDVTVAISDKDTTLATASDTVKVTSVGNLNGDDYVTAEDAQAIFAKIGTNDVASDVNCDGIVNLADVIALAKFAASAQTGADYLEMVGELDKLEAEVFALFEAGKLNDVNEDMIVNISDAYALIKRVTDELGKSYTKLGNKVTMKDVVAYLNVNKNLPTLA